MLKTNIKIFADCAHLESLALMKNEKWIEGFTTNPTLMRHAKVEDYVLFAKELLKQVPKKPVSFEVFADEFSEMEAQAKIIHSWGDNVFVKIPITNSLGQFSKALFENLSNQNIPLNITAIFTIEQVKAVLQSIDKSLPCILSIFAGRIADTGRDPIPVFKEAKALIKDFPNVQLLWASGREIFNLYQADEIGCDIITLSEDLLKKLKYSGKDLLEFSKETVKMFYEDAKASKYKIYDNEKVEV